VRQFLVGQGQWEEGFPGDVEHAMWMMIAGSPTLQKLHPEALDWLTQHGYQAEAEMLRERSKAPLKTSSTQPRAKARASTKKPHAKSKRTARPKPQQDTYTQD
jgi:hypothetical protein